MSACHSGQRPCRILVAEDTPDSRRLLELILAGDGVQVETACQGQEAFDKALQSHQAGRPFDLIVMDMEMPVLSGYDAVQRLRAAGYRKPIIALTAHVLAGDREKCLAVGCDAYAVKPIDRQTLLRLAGQYVDMGEPPIPAAPQPWAGDSLIGALSESDRRQLLASFSESLRQRAEQLEAAALANDLPQIIYLAHAVHGSTPLFGLEQISTAAGQLEQRARADASSQEIRQWTGDVSRMCREAAEAMTPRPKNPN